jgi:hypothetical protein
VGRPAASIIKSRGHEERWHGSAKRGRTMKSLVFQGASNLEVRVKLCVAGQGWRGGRVQHAALRLPFGRRSEKNNLPIPETPRTFPDPRRSVAAPRPTRRPPIGPATTSVGEQADPEQDRFIVFESGEWTGSIGETGRPEKLFFCTNLNLILWFFAPN